MKRGRLPAAVDLDQHRYPDALSSDQVLAQTGITYRQLDYWTRRGWLEPIPRTGQGKGNPRRWDSDVVLLIHDLVYRIRECPYDHGEVQE